MNTSILKYMLLAGLAASVISITCHSDCETSMCYGTLATHCIKCLGNKEPTTKGCVCKMGYFDFNGHDCSVYSQYCMEGTVDGAGVVTCTRCLTPSLMNDRSCDDTKLGLNISPTTTTYQNGIYDIVTFTSLSCFAFSSSGYCDSYCGDGFYLDQLVQCLKCKAGCKTCTTSTNCTECLDGSFFDNGTCKPCRYGCSKCESERSLRCMTCSKGYYFVDYTHMNAIGPCSLCSSNCQECSGPSAQECLIPTPEKYIENQGQSTATFKDCVSPCKNCTSATQCSSCINSFDFNESSSTCTPEVVHQPNCSSIFIPSMGDNYCQRCEELYYYNKKHNTCYRGTQNPQECQVLDNSNHLIETVCHACVGASYRVFNNRCILTSIPNCAAEGITWTGGHKFCTKCITGNIQIDGTCNSTCDTANGYYLTTSIIEGELFCSPCPKDCYSCQELNGSLYCPTCSSTESISYNGLCQNVVCKDNLETSSLKGCRYGVDQNCANDCMPLFSCSPGFTSSWCERNILDVTYADDYITLKVNQENIIYYQLRVEPNAIYETSSNISKVFCPTISDDLAYDGSLCEFDNTLKVLKVLLTPKKAFIMKKRKSIKLKTSTQNGALRLERRHILPSSIEAPYVVDFKETNTFTVSGTTISNILVDFPKKINSGNDLPLSIRNIENLYTYSNYSWQCTSVTLISNGSDDTAMKTAISDFLSGKNLSEIVIPSSALTEGRNIALQIVATDQLGNTHTTSFQATTTTDSDLLTMITKRNVLFTKNSEIHVLFKCDIPSFDIAQFAVNQTGLSSSIPNTSFKVSKDNSGVLIFTAKPHEFPNNFILELTYQAITTNSLSYNLQLVEQPLPISYAHQVAFNQSPDTIKLNLQGPEIEGTNIKIHCISEDLKSTCGTFDGPWAETVELITTTQTELKNYALFIIRNGVNRPYISRTLVQTRLDSSHFLVNFDFSKDLNNFESSDFIRLRSRDNIIVNVNGNDFELKSIKQEANFDLSILTAVKNVQQSTTKCYLKTSDAISVLSPTGFMMEAKLQVKQTAGNEEFKFGFVQYKPWAFSLVKKSEKISSGKIELELQAISNSPQDYYCKYPKDLHKHTLLASYRNTFSEKPVQLSEQFTSYKILHFLTSSFVTGVSYSVIKDDLCGSKQFSTSLSSSLTSSETLTNYCTQDISKFQSDTIWEQKILNLVKCAHAINTEEIACGASCADKTVYPTLRSSLIDAFNTEFIPLTDKSPFSKNKLFSLTSSFVNLLLKLDMTYSQDVTDKVNTLVSTLATEYRDTLKLVRTNSGGDNFSSSFKTGLKAEGILKESGLAFQALETFSNQFNHIFYNYDKTNRSARFTKLNQLVGQLSIGAISELKAQTSDRLEVLDSNQQIKLSSIQVKMPIAEPILFMLSDDKFMELDIQGITSEPFVEILVLRFSDNLVTKMGTVYNLVGDKLSDVQALVEVYSDYSQLNLAAASNLKIYQKTCATTACVAPTTKVIYGENYTSCVCQPLADLSVVNMFNFVQVQDILNGTTSATTATTGTTSPSATTGTTSTSATSTQTASNSNSNSNTHSKWLSWNNFHKKKFFQWLGSSFALTAVAFVYFGILIFGYSIIEKAAKKFTGKAQYTFLKKQLLEKMDTKTKNLQKPKQKTITNSKSKTKNKDIDIEKKNKKNNIKDIGGQQQNNSQNGSASNLINGGSNSNIVDAQLQKANLISGSLISKGLSVFTFPFFLAILLMDSHITWYFFMNSGTFHPFAKILITITDFSLLYSLVHFFTFFLSFGSIGVSGVGLFRAIALSILIKIPVVSVLKILIASSPKDAVKNLEILKNQRETSVVIIPSKQRRGSILSQKDDPFGEDINEGIFMPSIKELNEQQNKISNTSALPDINAKGRYSIKRRNGTPILVANSLDDKTPTMVNLANISKPQPAKNNPDVKKSNRGIAVLKKIIAIVLCLSLITVGTGYLASLAIFKDKEEWVGSEYMILPIVTDTVVSIFLGLAQYLIIEQKIKKYNSQKIQKTKLPFKYRTEKNLCHSS